MRSKRGKEEKRKRPSTEHRRGKMVSKATSKFYRRRKLFEEQKRKRLSERTRGTRVQTTKQGRGEMKDLEKEAEGGSSDLIYKGRSKVVT